MKKESYIVLDIETTGLSRVNHKITEIAALKVRNNKIIRKFSTLVNPEEKIPSFITSLTGINNQMVEDSPNIQEVLPKFINFLGKNPLIAHCASFDYGFLNYNSQVHLSKKLGNPTICTRKLSRRLIPELPNYKLSSLCEHFKVENKIAHRAMSDVQATNRIFNSLLEIMKKEGIENKEQIINFQDSKIRHK
jgi:DNA polymerase-3 subunit alpha (Gram-positive type)